LGLAVLQLLSWSIGIVTAVAFLFLCLFLAVAFFPYLTRFVSAEPDKDTTVEDRIRSLEQTLQNLRVSFLCLDAGDYPSPSGPRRRARGV
jgi:uncharacterized protein (DUF58 family)